MNNIQLARAMHRRLLKALPGMYHEAYAMPPSGKVRDLRDVIAKALIQCQPKQWRFRSWNEVLFLKMWPTPKDDGDKRAMCEWGWPAHWWTPTPTESTDAEPGSEEKLAVLVGRAERGEELFADGDRWVGDERKGDAA